MYVGQDHIWFFYFLFIVTAIFKNLFLTVKTLNNYADFPEGRSIPVGLKDLKPYVQSQKSFWKDTRVLVPILERPILERLWSCQEWSCQEWSFQDWSFQDWYKYRHKFSDVCINRDPKTSRLTIFADFFIRLSVALRNQKY